MTGTLGPAIEWDTLHGAVDEVALKSQSDFLSSLFRCANKVTAAGRKRLNGAQGNSCLGAFDGHAGFTKGQIDRSACHWKWGASEALNFRNADQVAAAEALTSV